MDKLSCVNNCGKECCTQHPWIEHTLCGVCKETVMVWLVCIDPECRHVFDIHTSRDSIQFNPPGEFKTMYVCRIECVRKIKSVSVHGLHGIDDNGKSFTVSFEPIVRNQKGE